MSLPATDDRLDARQLAEAFRQFSEASEALTGAYAGLQTQVGQLTERLSVLMGALPAGVVVLDRDGFVVQANRAVEAMFGQALAGVEWAHFSAARLAATDTPGEWQFETAGETRRVTRVDAALESGDGRIVLLNDVTDAHRMRLAVERNERLAAMGEMVAGLAHQLRTPLAAALLYTATLVQQEMGPADRERIGNRAIERLRHLEKLIRDMLLFARGETLGREPFSICELVAELTQTLEPLARAKGLDLASACTCGDTRVVGDRKAIAGALTNLLENAVQALDGGGVIRFDAALDGPLARFRVADSGRGIDPALQSRLFEPFFTTRPDGTGLGLAIARGVARAHGGDIGIQSEPGHGTTFTLTLAMGA
ncbi:MAG TPA: ATP-binding protein [Zoogloea sp.]|uniref:sensor histidine kinase n=1 Tax=Zoogloea sp. TaxID=49181 RepID=UPI002BE6742D|nr:ATP-binding protein [Zoogloea sp.]HOB46595.1 ATP-binding protein [Zoogloea sp.]HQA12028.1 ATP-binding protein [Zoogloea sp.]HQE39840.1 ATP-binding protein [Zoogloea sp.]